MPTHGLEKTFLFAVSIDRSRHRRLLSCSLDQEYHDALPIRTLNSRQAKTPTQIDHRQYGTSQIDDTFNKGRRLRDVSQFLG